MVRKKRAKTGGYEVNAFKQGRGAPESEGNEQVEEDFIALDVPRKGRDEDAEESDVDDAEMFDLGQGVSSSSESDDGRDGSESDSDSDDSDDEDNEDDNGMGEDEENLRALADNLPASLRQKVLLGKTNFDSDDDGDGSGSSGDDDNDDDAGVKGVTSWGKKKSYYTGDTADLEIGQDVQDAIDEEEAALSLQQERLESMRESDFLDDDNSDGEGSGEEDDVKESKPHKRSNKNSVIGSLESIVLDEVSSLELCITNTFATNERSLSDMTNA